MSDIRSRKGRHIRISLDERVEADVPTGFEDVTLVHRCLPEIDLDDVDMSTTLFGHKLSAPFIISAITGGTDEAGKINETLAKTAEKFGIGIGVGSQRVAIEHPEVEGTFSVVREVAPNAFVMANLGCPQLALGWGAKQAKKAIGMVDADALAIHMNPLQEAVQVRGDTKYAGILGKVKELAASLDTPLVMKETGCGISKEDAARLDNAGVAGFEISGLGGTSWAAVEHHIAREVGEPLQEYLGKSMWNWGIPSASSLIEVRTSTEKVVIASGGLRTGQDAARALSLGADAIGIAKPFMEKAVQGSKALEEHVEAILAELRVCMFLVGAKNIKEMRRVSAVVTGWTAEWLRARGLDPALYAARGGG